MVCLVLIINNPTGIWFLVCLNLSWRFLSSRQPVGIVFHACACRIRQASCLVNGKVSGFYQFEEICSFALCLLSALSFSCSQVVWCWFYKLKSYVGLFFVIFLIRSFCWEMEHDLLYAYLPMHSSSPHTFGSGTIIPATTAWRKAAVTSVMTPVSFVRGLNWQSSTMTKAPGRTIPEISAKNTGGSTY